MDLILQPQVKVVRIFECYQHFHEDGSKCYASWNCKKAHVSKLVWRDESQNLIVTVGLNKLLDATFKTGLASPAWYVGLVGATHTYNADDTMGSHSGWAENAHYTGNRPALNLSGNSISGGSVSNSANKAVFAMTGTSNPDTINGSFLNDAATGTAGTLYGEGDFSAARSVYDGDTINGQITLTVTAS